MSVKRTRSAASLAVLLLWVGSCGPPATQTAPPTVQPALSPEDDLMNKYLATGDQFRNSGLPLKAIEQYEKALEIDEENPEVYQRLGYALIEAEDYERAVKTYRRWVELTPKDCHSHASLGFAYLRQNLTDQAMGEYEKALELCPDDPNAFVNMGKAYREAGYLLEATEVFRRAIELNPDDIGAWESLAALCWDLELYPEATSAYEAILAHPDNGKDGNWITWARGRLAHMYTEMGSYENAIPNNRYVMESSYANEAAQVRAIRGLAVAYERTEQLDLAIQLYETLIQKSPDRPVYYYRLGELMNDAGRYNEAISRVQQGKQLDTECGAHAYCVVGVAYEKLGQYDRAKREFKKALNGNDANFNDYASKQIERQEQLEKIEELKKQKEKYGY